jgi:hypothetical protein
MSLRAEKDRLEVERTQKEKARYKATQANGIYDRPAQICKPSAGKSLHNNKSVYDAAQVDRREQMRARLRRRKEQQQQRKQREELRIVREGEDERNLRPESPLEGWGRWGGNTDEAEGAVGGWWHEPAI